MKTKGMKITAIMAVVVFASVVALPYLINVDRFRPQLESSLASSLGREVHLGHMELSLFAGGARVEQISIADDPSFSQGTFLEARSLGVGMNFLSLIFSRSLHVKSLTIEEPKMMAIQSSSGKWNFGSLGRTSANQEDNSDSTGKAESSLVASTMSSMVLDHIKISNATVELGSSHASQRTTLKNVNIELKDVSLDSAITLSLSAAAGDGKLQIEGTAGPIKPADDTGKSTAVMHMKINGNHVPLDTVEVFLPTLGITLPGGSKLHGGMVNAKLSLDGPIDHPTTSGNVEIAKAHLKGFDLGSRLSQPGISSFKDASDLAITSLNARLHVSPHGTHISGFNGEFVGIGSITGDGDVSSTNHLQFKMIAHVASNGALRFGLNHVGLRNMPNDLPFQVVGTTSTPIVIPDLGGMAKSTAKSLAANAATNAGNGALKKITGNNTPVTPTQSASTKKGGFFHNLFHHKNKQTNASNSTQMAAEKSKF